MDTTPLIGWLSAVILVVTLGAQLLRQLGTGDVSGVSPALYGGQIAASAGFATYAALAGDLVFVVVSAVLAAVAVFGLAVTLHQRRAQAREDRPQRSRAALVLVASNGLPKAPPAPEQPELPDPRRVIAFRPRAAPAVGPQAPC